MVVRVVHRALAVVPRHSSISQTTSSHQFQSSSRLFPKKGAEDKDSISTESTEYSRSGGDGASAAEDVAYDPDVTSPEAEHESARQNSEQSNESNPLDVSPANEDVSITTTVHEGYATASKEEIGQESERARTSSTRSPAKDASGNL